MAISCTICSKPDSQLCGKCRSAAYCSVECQQTDWPTHKLLCSQFSVLSDRPGPSFKRAILFPEEGPNPVVFWVEFRNYGYGEIPQLKGVMGDETLARVYSGRNKLRDLDLKGNLPFYHYDCYADAGAMVNKSILLVTKGKAPHCWRGSVVVLKEKANMIFHEDVTMADFRTIMDHLLTFGLPLLAELIPTCPLKFKAKGVKVNCSGDINRFNKKYVAVDVPKDHPVFLAESSPISTLVGMSVKAHQYPFDKIWKNMTHSGLLPWSNRTAAFLHMEADPKNAGTWGSAPNHWQNNNGNMLVVGEDKGDISPADVEKLCDFCQYKMRPLFEESSLAAGYVRSKQEVMAHLTPAGFRKYIDEEHKSDAIQQLRKEEAARCGYNMLPLQET
ncbi:MAG: hypothetical protein Q9225_005887 [Loekoesia sp. 1 TL-2023]